MASAPAAVSTSPTRTATDGALRVLTDPAGAQVVLDGRIVGVTPVFVRWLVPGLHDLELTREGASLGRRRVKIALGRVLNLRLPGRLPAPLGPAGPSPGSLTIQTDPPGASVLLPGGKLIGRTPISKHPLPAGTYTLVLELAGREVQERETTIEPGRETRIVTLLAPRRDLVDVFRRRRRDREKSLYLAEARRLMKRGEFDLALERTRQAQAADPESAEVYEVMASIYNSMGDRAGYAEAQAKAGALRAGVRSPESGVRSREDVARPTGR